MAFFDKYPYTDFHELNLDWLLNKMKELEIEFDEFKVVNNITFSGQWDITKQYPAWTIVSDNNIGYVSIQPVPVGITLNNGAYWVEVIDYTAQIAGLQQRVIDIEDDLRDNVHPDIIQNANDIAAINHKINMDERVFLFVGDSFATSSVNWVDKTAAYAGIVNYNNLAVSGTAFYNGSFKTQLENYAGDRDEVTDIVVGGGLNDSIYTAYSSTLINAIGDFATYAKTEYPNAKLWLAFMGNALDDSPVIGGRTVDKRRWTKWMYNKAVRQGFTIIDGADLALSTSVYNFGSDRLHPSVDGTDEIAQIITNGLLGLNYKAVYPFYSAGYTATNYFTNVGLNINYEVNEETSRIVASGSGDIKLNTNVSLPAATNIEIGELSNVFFNENLIVHNSVTITDSGLFKELPCDIIFSSEKVYVKIYNVNAAGTYWESIPVTTTASLYFHIFEKTFPTIMIN